MASVLAKLGYGWYEQMLSEVGVSTVGDLMASATAAATTTTTTTTTTTNDDDDGARRDRDRVAAFLTANAFSAAHADAIAEEILEIARATEKDKRPAVQVWQRGRDVHDGHPGRRGRGAFYTLVSIRPRSRGERRSLRTFPGVSLRPSLGFNPRPRRL